MRILVTGSGGVGGYVWARVACSGRDISFVARELDVLRSCGLRMARLMGDIHHRCARGTEPPGRLWSWPSTRRATRTVSDIQLVRSERRSMKYPA